MGMNDTPAGDRLHIGLFGCRNAGKSSLINALTGQDLALVSPTPGTTTDPVSKAMEILPIGPVMLTDTAGLDDAGELGELRVQKSLRVLNRTDLALLVSDGTMPPGPADRQLQAELERRQIPFLIVRTKQDLPAFRRGEIPGAIEVSVNDPAAIHRLRERIAAMPVSGAAPEPFICDRLVPEQAALLVIPVDESAPKGRLILPQQQVIRELLEADIPAIAVRDSCLEKTLAAMGDRIQIVITDSQIFGRVAAVTPPEMLLTSFSILMARRKGFLEQAVRGAKALDTIVSGDRILISEGCTHHRQCGDIGTVKLPAWIREYTGQEPVFTFTAGNGFPEDLSPFKMVIHCGGCMLNEPEIRFRRRCAAERQIPFTNYGIVIAGIKGILDRALSPFPGLL
ncbi:MAG: [Lentisphaeria bacterium]|nr:[FeFe] hydrogenase H-cluster maturation GTPase HydF [Lentisphaeria bacterium]